MTRLALLLLCLLAPSWALAEERFVDLFDGRTLAGWTVRGGEATYRVDGDRIVPTIRGSAFVTAESRLLLDPSDPFVHGVRRG